MLLTELVPLSKDASSFSGCCVAEGLERGEGMGNCFCGLGASALGKCSDLLVVGWVYELGERICEGYQLRRMSCRLWRQSIGH